MNFLIYYFIFDIQLIPLLFSLYYISEYSMIKSISKRNSSTPCLACFNGEYPNTTNIPFLSGFKDI